MLDLHVCEFGIQSIEKKICFGFLSNSSGVPEKEKKFSSKGRTKYFSSTLASTINYKKIAQLLEKHDNLLIFDSLKLEYR